MEEKEEEMNIKEFEYMLRNERTFLEELKKLGVGEEAEAKIDRRLEDIEKTIE